MKMSGPAAGRSRAMRLVGWLAVTSMLLGALVGPNVGAVLAAPGAIYTSNVDGSIINANIYGAKEDVYLTGGPCNDSGHLDAGDYYFEVTSPDGQLLSEDAIGDRFFSVNGDGYIEPGSSSHDEHDVSCTDKVGVTVKLMPYADTPNSGGEYKLTIAEADSVEACDGFDEDSTNFEICNAADSKSDNFKVLEGLNQAAVLIEKLVDGDGDLETTDDQEDADGWEFSVTLSEGEIIDSQLVTVDGLGGASIAFPGESTGVTVTEQQQPGFELLDAQCFPIDLRAEEGLSQQNLRRAGSLHTQGLVGDIGELDGNAISFDVSDGDAVGCVFINAEIPEEEPTPPTPTPPTPTPSFSGGVEGITGTPSVTLPPTDGVPAATAPASETWRILLIAMAVLLASILVVTPKPVSRRQ